jgi:multicomponent Na+:H+ antiporter subunit C
MTPEVLYGLAGIGLFGIGLFRALTDLRPLARILALNVCGIGAAFLIVVAGYRAVPGLADPVPHALVITGIVVMVSATAVALALLRRIHSLGEESRDR